MHIIGILIAIASLIFWISRASRGVGDIADAANTVANLPRRRRFSKKYNQSGFDLVETPIEAATVMMISTARMSDKKRVTEDMEQEIISQLIKNMDLNLDDADGVYRQMHSLTYDITLPESALFPMVDILKNQINKEDAEGLVLMMDATARSEGVINSEQKEFIRRYRERMGLLH
ncbi:hypothetical protein [Hellea balneolensis]|uniref:hypothetical protein n=1 Tax=Hellea balneolensis TaxID=287478 RepID=UPI00041CD0A7|nr:hypothetical protein [Hellea balneolensis]